MLDISYGNDITTNIINHLLCTRYSVFIYANTFDIHYNLMVDVDIVIPFCGRRSCSLKGLSNFPELISSIAEIQTQTVWLYCSYLAAIMVITTTTRLSWNCSNRNLNIDMKFLTIKIMKKWNGKFWSTKIPRDS